MCRIPAGPLDPGTPGEANKSLAAFQQDLSICQQHAVSHTGFGGPSEPIAQATAGGAGGRTVVGATPGGPGAGTGKVAAPASAKPPDEISYAQCMAGRGDIVQTAPSPLMTMATLTMTGTPMRIGTVGFTRMRIRTLWLWVWLSLCVPVFRRRLRWWRAWLFCLQRQAWRISPRISRRRISRRRIPGGGFHGGGFHGGGFHGGSHGWGFHGGSIGGGSHGGGGGHH